jgi:predicted Ser/Thr protein kinase
VRKTFGPLKAKQCKLGAQCGGSCIAKSKNCTVGLSPKDKGKVAAAAKALRPQAASKIKQLPATAPVVIAKVKAAEKAEIKVATAKVAAARVEPDKYGPKPSPPANKSVTTKEYLAKTKALYTDKELKLKNKEFLGKGAYGLVYGDGNKVLKEVRKGMGQSRIPREVEFQQVAHGLGVAPKVLAYSKKGILMEVAPGMTALQSKLAQDGEYMKQADWAKYHDAKGKALLSLHKVGIAHNDSHPENIFYDKATNKVTIIDFGLATRNTPSDLFQEYKRGLEAYISINYNQQFTTVDSYVEWLKN